MIEGLGWFPKYTPVAVSFSSTDILLRSLPFNCRLTFTGDGGGGEVPECVNNLTNSSSNFEFDVGIEGDLIDVSLSLFF